MTTRTTSAALSLFLCGTAAWPATAWANRKHAALVVDANTGRVISEQSADEPRYPASLTKIMTIYMVFDMIEKRKLTFDTKITFSQTATRVQPTKLDLDEGETITVLEAVKALITKSANDASVALAEHIAGSEPQFAALMTRTAQRIGMTRTTFKNAHGLPHPEQITTARDMITLGLRLQDDFPKHYHLFSTPSFNFRGDTLKNHNTMLLTYEGTDGIKTGYIGASGFNLVANVRRNDKHVIGVVFGGASAAARNQTMRTLLNIALVRGSTTKTRVPALIARARPAPMAAPTTVAASIATPAPAAAPRPTPAPAAKAAQAPIGMAASAPNSLPPPPPAKAEPRVQVVATKPIFVAQRPPAPAAPVAEAVPQFATSFVQASATAAAPPLPAAVVPPSAPAPAAFAPPRQQVAAVAPAGLPTPAARSNLGASGPYQIQVGAYAIEADARRQLEQVKTQTGPLLAQFPAIVVAANANGKTVYRARYTGFDTANGGSICNELRRRQIDCMVAKAE